MQVLLDKLVATIIAITISLMIFQINLRNGETVSETTAFFALTTQTESFAKILRRDLQGIVEVNTTEEVSNEFSFVTRIGQDTTKYTIDYRRVLAFERHGHTYYQIQRFVDGVRDGASHEIITDWAIQALNEDAGAIEDANNAAQVYVRFTAASPFLDSNIVGGFQWESRFFPPLRND